MRVFLQLVRAALRPGPRLCRLGVWLAACGVVQAQTEDTASRWAFSVGKNAAIYSSPAIDADGTVYVGAEFLTTPGSGLVLAVFANGKEKWHINLLEEVEGSPALSGDGTTVYIGCADGRLYALDTANGNTRWTFDTGRSSAIYCAPAVAADGTIYVGSTYLTTLEDSVFYAVNPDGTRKWFVSAGGSVESSPAIAPDGTVYFGAGNGVYAINADGTHEWTFPTNGPVFGSPALAADGTIYVGSDANEFFALTPQGKVKWQVPVTTGSGASLGADGTVYIGTTDGRLYAFTPDGQLQPGFPVSIGSGIFSVPAIRADGTILFGANDNAVHAMNPDGTVKWTTKVGDDVATSPAIADDGTIYIASAGGTLYAFPGSGSPLSRYSSWPMLNREPMHSSRAAVPVRGGHLVNLATRGQAGAGVDLIAGFVLQGTTSKALLVRGVGPTLAPYGVSVPMPNPKLTIRLGPSVAYTNDDWQVGNDPAVIANTGSKVGAFPLPDGSKDAAVIATAQPGVTYTTAIESVDGQPGVALVETYDADQSSTTARLINLSTRGHVGTGENVLVPGLVIGPGGPMHLLIRAVGPGLTTFHVADVVAQPSIAVYDRTGTLIGQNTGWTSHGLKGDLSGAATLAGAFPLQEGSADSAMILRLDPGAYTFQVSGVGGGTGEALVEVYALPH
jgi:outer membrane protein assembly factor BamB